MTGYENVVTIVSKRKRPISDHRNLMLRICVGWFGGRRVALRLEMVRGVSYSFMDMPQKSHCRPICQFHVT